MAHVSVTFAAFGSLAVANRDPTAVVDEARNSQCLCRLQSLVSSRLGRRGFGGVDHPANATRADSGRTMDACNGPNNPSCPKVKCSDEEMGVRFARLIAL
jgi:hypothetical protein